MAGEFAEAKPVLPRFGDGSVVTQCGVVHEGTRSESAGDNRGR